MDGGATTYTYDADGQRVRKDSPSGSTEYVYFGGSIIAEKTVSNGNWSDYVFAGGKRIVKADSFKDEIAVAGNNTAAGQYTWWGITGAPNVTVRTGDKLFFYHLQQGSAQGGMILTFSDGTNTGWAAQDQDGSYANVGTVVGQWHARIVDLSAYAGKTINQFLVGNSSAAPVGTWNAWYSDIAVLSADGTVTPVYTGQTSAGFQFVSTSSPTAANLSASVIHDSTVGANAQLTTNYYHGDQIGSSRLMTAGTGWPTWQGTFLPFGEEYSPQTSTNHYKFTGKEQDNESGLDDMGARYYSSAIGRFMSPDPNMESVRRTNPQTWNRYSYVLNLPLILVDPTGEVWVKSNDKDHPYTWQDSCGQGQTCYNQIATQVGESVNVYGPKDKNDISTFNTNDDGYIDLSQVAKTDGAFFEFQSGVTNTFASPQTAVDLYNAAGEYHDEHPNDSKLSLNDVGSATGGHISPHQTHDLGRSVDMRYMDNDGKTTNKILNADDDRMRNLIGHFQDNGFNQIYSDNDQGYGTSWAPGHANHIHMGKTKGTAKCEISSCS